MYSTLLNKAQVRFLYFNKNDGNLMEIVTPHNRAVYEQQRGRALSVVVSGSSEDAVGTQAPLARGADTSTPSLS